MTRAGAGRWRVRISTDVFAHAVHLALPTGAVPSDDYFDLLPSASREVLVTFDGALQATASSVVLK